MTIVALVLAVATIALGLVVLRLRRELADARAVRVAPPTGPESLSGRDVVIVEIRNHTEIAERRNRLARTLQVVSPPLLRGLVHREFVRELRAELVEEGVDADVRIRRLIEPPTG